MTNESLPEEPLPDKSLSNETTSPKPPRGPFAISAGVLFHPRRSMAALSQAKRRWWIVPAILLLVALTLQGIAYANANATFVYQQQATMLESAQNGEFGVVTEMPPMSAPHPLTVVLPIAGRTVGSVVTWLIWAGLIALASTFLGHNGARFGGLFAMVVWARVPITVRHVVQAIAMTLTGKPIYNQGLSGLVMDNAPSFTVNSFQGYVPPSRSTQVLSALLGKVDIYMVWTLILTGIGVWAFAHVPRRRAALMTVGIWVIATLVGLLPTLVGIGQSMRLF
jgi:hypothetical protein